MTTLVIKKLSEYWLNSKMQLVKVLKETTNLELKSIKAIIDDIYSNAYAMRRGLSHHRILIESINVPLFEKITDDTGLEYDIIQEIDEKPERAKIKKIDPFDKIGQSVSFLQTLSESANDIIDLKNEYDTLKNVNEELVKENQSLKKAIYDLAWTLTNYHSVHLTFNDEVQKANGLIENLRHEVDSKSI